MCYLRFKFILTNMYLESIWSYLLYLTISLNKNFQDSAQINGFDFKDELEPPRLPEEGLKTRQDAESIYLDQICRRESREM